MLPARMLLYLLKAPGLCMVCYGNARCLRHNYGKSFDNTRPHIFLKIDARKSRSQPGGHSGRLTVYVQTP